MKHMLCFDHPTLLRTVLDNSKTSGTVWFSIVQYMQFSECMFKQRRYLSRNLLG